MVSKVKGQDLGSRGLGRRATYVCTVLCPYLRVTAQVRIPSPRPGGFFVILPLDMVSEDDLSDGGTRDKTGKYRCVVQLGRQRQGAERGAGCHYNTEAPKKTLHRHVK